MSGDSRREKLEKRLEALTEEYSALNDALTIERGPVDRVRLQRELEKKAKEMDEINQKIATIDLKSDPNRALHELQSKLPEINFKLLEEIIRKLLRDYPDEGCAALLLFQKSTRMGGEWCAKRIHKLVGDLTTYGGFRYIELEFKAGERADRRGLLRRLAKELDVDVAGEDLQRLLSCVVQKLCGSLQNGSVILLEFRQCDYLSSEPDVFHWIVKDFWNNVVRELAVVAEKYYEVKVMMLLFVDGLLPEGCVPVDCCCSPDEFRKDKLLTMSLDEWTRDDIRQWIARYSGLTLLRPQIDLMADKIYGSTGGLPTLVVHELLKECCPSMTE